MLKDRQPIVIYFSKFLDNCNGSHLEITFIILPVQELNVISQGQIKYILLRNKMNLWKVYLFYDNWKFYVVVFSQ